MRSLFTVCFKVRIFFFFFLTKNLSKAGSFRIPTSVRQTSNPCKTPPLYGSGSTRRLVDPNKLFTLKEIRTLDLKI
jgi:hypothetical protein